MNELMKCICGGSATSVQHEAGMKGTQGYDRWNAVRCKACGLTFGGSDRRFRSPSDARKAWNTLMLTPAQDTALLDWIARQCLEELGMGLVIDANDDGQYYVCGDSAKTHYGPTLRAALLAAMNESTPPATR